MRILERLGTGGDTSVGKRRCLSTFSEVSLPVSGDWNVVLAGRHDGCNDVGPTFSRQIASSFRLHDAITVRGSLSKGFRAPDLSLLHFDESIDYPYVCDTKNFTGDLEDCDEGQVERVTGGNPDLKPDKAESSSIGVATDFGPVSLSADWFRIWLENSPARLSAQKVIGLEAAGMLPTGVEVEREGGVIRRITSPVVNSGETDVRGLEMRARVDWEAD